MEYGTERKEFSVGKYGGVIYDQWLHPLEGKKSFTEEQINKAAKLIRPGSVVIDIGAHSGDTTIPYMVATGRGGVVLAFEPNPSVFRVLAQNCFNNADRCRVIPIMSAVAEGHGEAVFHYTDVGNCNGGFAAMLQQGVGVAGNTYPVSVITWELRNYLRRNYPELIPRISFIKIDTEGFDKNIIGTLKTLLSEIPDKPIIQTELYDGLTLAERKELYDAITNLHYDSYDYIVAQRDLDKLGPPLSEEDFLYMKVQSGHDLICLPRK